jgi:hypothetical protein
VRVAATMGGFRSYYQFQQDLAKEATRHDVFSSSNIY